MQAGPSGTETGLRSTLVSPAGSGGLRARLVRGTADVADPFVTVHDGRFARILLAELVGDDDLALTQFAWKLRTDLVAANVVPGRQPPSNAELDRVWQQERAELLRVHSPHVVAPVAVPPAMTQSPPVFFCRRVDTYFHPVCPETGAMLSVCRDDAVLAAAGLPAYGDDTVRYLHASGGASSSSFYVKDGEPTATATARIESMGGLIRGWSRVLEGDQVLPDLPCQTCEHRVECFAAPTGRVLAEQHLHAVSFYDVDSIALELASTDFDTAIMRLGGGFADAAPSGWVNSFDRRQRTLEVLRLKLAAFADVCRGVAALHAAGRPHLGVSPANLVAFDGAGSSAMPAHWQLRFALTDLGGATPVQVPGGATETLWQPGREVSEDETSRLFLAPSLRSLEGGSVTMSVTGRAVAEDGGASRYVIEVHRAGVPSFVLPGDLLLVEPVVGGGGVAARVDDVSARGLVATVAAADGVQPAWGDGAFDARLSFVRRSGPSADLYGLGMLLLRILLVHDEQSLGEVAAAIENCLQVMIKAATDDSVALSDRWQEILDGDVGEGRFACWHVMHQRTDRQVVFDSELRSEGIIPKTLWHTLLGLAGRLLLASPLSRAENDAAGAAPIPSVLADLAVLERQLHVELFEQVARDECIAAVCTQRLLGLRAELAEVQVGEEGTGTASDDVPLHTMPAPMPGEGVQALPGQQQDSPGFVLAIGRVGDATIQQHHFSQDRVTIGRREGTNLLVLTDPMVSSKHAVIERVDGEYTLFDCGSTNGTEVDGIRLPVEVPHPLDDGSVIHIRPFMLSFRCGGVEPVEEDAVPLVSGDEVYEQLRAVYAAHAERGRHDLHAEMTVTLDNLRGSLGRRGLLTSLEELGRRLSSHASTNGDGGVATTPAAAAPSPEQAELGDAALRAIRQLGRSLTDGAVLDTEAQLQEFVGRVHRFVDVSSRWIEDMLEWRRVFGKQLDLRATQTGGARPPLRTAADVCEELLVPTGSQDGAAASEYFLSRFFDDVLAILEDLMTGNQRVRDTVREQLDPDRLIAEAGKEAKLGLLVQAASGSVLWKLYTSVFESVTAGDSQETELRRLLTVAAERRQNREL